VWFGFASIVGSLRLSIDITDNQRNHYHSTVYRQWCVCDSLVIRNVPARVLPGYFTSTYMRFVTVGRYNRYKIVKQSFSARLIDRVIERSCIIHMMTARYFYFNQWLQIRLHLLNYTYISLLLAIRKRKNSPYVEKVYLYFYQLSGANRNGKGKNCTWFTLLIYLGRNAWLINWCAQTETISKK